jgi:hypothetical protein
MIHRSPNMKRQLLSALTFGALLARASFGQARVVSAPPEPSLLVLTSAWSRESMLGDLRELKTDRDHLELRVWGGFGLTTRTQGVVLRRSAGRWSAFLARVNRCEIQISKSVADTASRATTQGYLADARRRCGIPLSDVGPGARILTTDTLMVYRLDLPDSTIESAWTAAERSGVFELPGRVERNRPLDDAFMYVVELRRGGDYRASVIEHVEHPEAKADRQIEDIYAAVNRLLETDQRLQP